MAVINFMDYRRRRDGYTYGDTGDGLDLPDYEDEYEFEDPFDYEDDAPLREGNRANLYRHLRSLLQVVLLTGGVLGVILLIVLQTRSRVFTSASYRKLADIVAQENAGYLPVDGHIITYSRDGISCMDANAGKVWSVTFEMQQPIVDVTGSVAAIADYNGSIVYVVNTTKLMGTISTNMPIHGISVAENGEVAAVLEDGDTTWVYLYDCTGNTIAYFKTTMNQSGYPISVAISPGGELVSISHLTIGRSHVNTSIAFYNFGAVGQNARENNVSGFNYDDEMFPIVKFMNAETSVAVSDRRMVFFKGNEIPQSTANLMFNENILGVYVSSSYVALLFPDTTGQEAYSLRIYNTDGVETGRILFSMDYTSIQLSAERVLIYNDQAIRMYSVTGLLKYEGQFPEFVQAVVPVTTSSNKLLLVTPLTVERMVLE